MNLKLILQIYQEILSNNQLNNLIQVITSEANKYQISSYNTKPTPNLKNSFEQYFGFVSNDVSIITKIYDVIMVCKSVLDEYSYIDKLRSYK